MKLKSVLGYAAVVLSALAVAAGISVSVYRVPREFAESRETGEMLGSIARYIQENGVTPELSTLLTDVPKPRLWTGTVVTMEQNEQERLIRFFDDKILAASDPLLVGLTMTDAHYRASYGLKSDEGVESVGLTVVSKDGNTYTVTAFGKRYLGYLYDARTAFAVLAAGGWLAIAGWVVADARERQAPGLAGWTLLAFLTGPIALGVWLTARPGSRSRACPGCGSKIPQGSIYCVRCGHPIVATCPKCGKTVDVEWEYCGFCGTPLREGT